MYVERNGIMIGREVGYPQKTGYEAAEYTLTWRGEIYSFGSPNQPIPSSPIPHNNCMPATHIFPFWA